MVRSIVLALVMVKLKEYASVLGSPMVPLVGKICTISTNLIANGTEHTQYFCQYFHALLSPKSSISVKSYMPYMDIDHCNDSSNTKR